MKAVQLTASTVVSRMKRLLLNEDFRTLQSMWLNKRMSIIEEGKKLKRPEDWARIQGFDEGVMLPERWANKVLKEKSDGRMPLGDD